MPCILRAIIIRGQRSETIAADSISRRQLRYYIRDPIISREILFPTIDLLARAVLSRYRVPAGDNILIRATAVTRDNRFLTEQISFPDVTVENIKRRRLTRNTRFGNFYYNRSRTSLPAHAYKLVLNTTLFSFFYSPDERGRSHALFDHCPF